MARRLLGEEWQGDIRERWFADDDDNVMVERHQDAQRAVDLVSAVNAEGGAKTIDGLGKPVLEIPLVAAMEWAEQRGIPWEKLLYTNEYDDEFKKFAAEHSRLQYQSRKSFH